jgi:hypothetical protein
MFNPLYELDFKRQQQGIQDRKQRDEERRSRIELRNVEKQKKRGRN